MKIAIPSSDKSGLDSEIFLHFGRCPFYTIVDTESDKVEVLTNTSVHFGGEFDPPNLLSKAGIEGLVCSDIGTKAIRLFDDLGIEIFIGAGGTVEEALAAWKEGKLQKPAGEYTCEGHRDEKGEQ